MATTITTAFEKWNAKQVLNGLAARPDTVIFANIPGLDPDAEIDRTAGLPADKYIVYRHRVDQAGIVNANAVAYSVILDTTVGNFEFNYMGLLHSSSNTLCMIVHTQPQQKIKTADGNQGNNVTRTFLMSFAGAAESSQINVNAETWQIDFSARLTGIDESIRLTNLDYYGSSTFIGDGFKVAAKNNNYIVSAGVGYVGGLRVTLENDLVLENKASSVWIDVSLQGTITGLHKTVFSIFAADSASDYIDSNNTPHYVAKLAFWENKQLNDARKPTPINKLTTELAGNTNKLGRDIENAIAKHAKSISHPLATLKTPGFVQLSDALDDGKSEKAATTAAVKKLSDKLSGALSAINAIKIPVTSVNNKTGNIVLTGNDITPPDVEFLYPLGTSGQIDSNTSYEYPDPYNGISVLYLPEVLYAQHWLQVSFLFGTNNSYGARVITLNGKIYITTGNNGLLEPTARETGIPQQFLPPSIQKKLLFRLRVIK